MFRSNLDIAGKLILITAFAFLPKMGQAEDPVREKETKAAAGLDQADFAGVIPGRTGTTGIIVTD